MKWPSYKVLTWVVTLLFIAIIALYVFEFRALNNTIDASDLLMKGSMIGLIIGIILGAYFHLKIKPKEAVPTIRLWLTCLLVPLIFMPMIGSLINRKLSRKTIVRQVEFLEAKPIHSTDIELVGQNQIQVSGYHIFVFVSGKIERFTSENILFPKANKGDLVKLKLKKGVFGYEYLER